MYFDKNSEDYKMGFIVPLFKITFFLLIHIADGEQSIQRVKSYSLTKRKT